MYKMDNLCILNDFPKFESKKANYKRDGKEKSRYYVNKA